MPKRKAPNGSGTIRLRKDGKTWEARYSVRDLITGQSVQKSVYASSQEECAKKLRKATADIDEGTYQEPSRLTVGKWADIWLAEYCGSVKDTTLDKYEMYIRLYIKPELGGFKLQALGAHSIQALYNKLQRREKKPLSAKSIGNLHGVLHPMMEQAIKLKYRPDNPCKAVTKPRVEKKEMQFMQGEQLDAFLAAIKAHQFESIFLVDVFTGMRQGEILGLTWADVDFDKGIIHVRKQLQKERKKGGIRKRLPLKNDRMRSIHPAPFVMDILKAEQRKQKKRQVRAGGAWDNGMGLVFTNEAGRYQSESTVYKNFKKIVIGIGEEALVMHSLRHTFAMLSLQMGVDFKTLQKEMGHSTSAFTLDVYGHASDEMLKSAGNSMQRYINEWKARQ